MENHVFATEVIQMKSNYNLKCYCKSKVRGLVHIAVYDITFSGKEAFYQYITNMPLMYYPMEVKMKTRKLPTSGPKRWLKTVEHKQNRIPCLFK